MNPKRVGLKHAKTILFILIFFIPIIIMVFTFNQTNPAVKYFIPMVFIIMFLPFLYVLALKLRQRKCEKKGVPGVGKLIEKLDKTTTNYKIPVFDVEIEFIDKRNIIRRTIINTDEILYSIIKEMDSVPLLIYKDYAYYDLKRIPGYSLPNKKKNKSKVKSFSTIKVNDNKSIDDVICSRCGAHNNKEFSFCYKCGNPLENEESIYCPYCGEKVTRFDRFCPKCNKEL